MGLADYYCGSSFKPDGERMKEIRKNFMENACKYGLKKFSEYLEKNTSERCDFAESIVSTLGAKGTYELLMDRKKEFGGSLKNIKYISWLLEERIRQYEPDQYWHTYAVKPEMEKLIGLLNNYIEDVEKKKLEKIEEFVNKLKKKVGHVNV